VAPREQTHVPMLMWLPIEHETLRACLQEQTSAKLTHDHLFHTVLGLVGVSASEYKPVLDVTASCRTR
jgi:lipid A ethanolaminephosphotransferase